MTLKKYLEILAICLGILTIEVIIANSLGVLNIGFLGVVLCAIDLIAVVAIVVFCKAPEKVEEDKK